MFVLGQKSLRTLEGVHPDLAKVVREAIKLTEVDFSVHEGVRTKETQARYLAQGVTKTLDSKHLIQKDGWAHAVDLVPYVSGSLRWEWPLIYPIADAMRKAAKREGVKLRWGGVWDRQMAVLDEDLREAVSAYCERHPGPDFLDGPHYEIVL